MSLWQADEQIWGRTAPILFPVVGKCFNNELLINEKKYAMPQHGFGRDMNFEVFRKTESQIIFRLASTDKTFLKYPFHFDLHLIYTLSKNKIECGYEVIKCVEKYFSPEKIHSRLLTRCEKGGAT